MEVINLKRKFNGNRLYLLTKIIVLIVTVIAFYRGWFVNDNDFYQGGVKMCGKYFDDANMWKGTSNNFEFNYKYYYKLGTDCDNSFLQEHKDFENYSVMALEISIFLPLSFFGGIGLYKYLFPTIKNDTDSTTSK